MDDLMKKLQESADYISERIAGRKVDIALVLGSGLGDLGDKIEDAVYIDYKEIPNFPVSTVEGHKGRLVVGKLEGRTVMCMQGRFHFYEGWTMDQCVYPIRTMYVMGIRNLFLTNAAGCVNKSWEPGTLMVIEDHIKMAPECPCWGPHHPELGARFFDMSDTYTKSLVKVVEKASEKVGVPVKKGVYMFFSGPNYETPAEVRFARIAGADAVGMSTVPEAIAASQMKMNTLGISCLTNMAAGILPQPLSHQEVMETGERVKVGFEKLVREIVASWPL